MFTYQGHGVASDGHQLRHDVHEDGEGQQDSDPWQHIRSVQRPLNNWEVKWGKFDVEWYFLFLREREMHRR